MYDILPVQFLQPPESAWPAYLKISNIELELLSALNMLLMIEKGIRAGMCHLINRHCTKNEVFH